MIDWTHWHNEPYLVGGLVLLGWLWAVLAGPLRARLIAAAIARGTPVAADTPYPRIQARWFYSSLIVFYLAVGSPLDQIGERFLFSAHMLQHQLLVYPAAIFFLLGLPHWMVDAVLAKPGLRGPGRLLTHPVSCAIIYTLVISVWHAPSLYDWALQNKLIHVGEHVTFFGAALFYWWPLLSPSRALPPIGYGAQMLYMLAVLIAMTPIFAYITFSGDILYPTYEYAPRLFPNFTAAADQLLAGVGMKTVGMGAAMTAFGFSFYRWFQAGQRADGEK